MRGVKTNNFTREMILLDYIRDKSSYDVLSVKHNVPKGTVRRIIDNWIKISVQPIETRHHGRQVKIIYT